MIGGNDCRNEVWKGREVFEKDYLNFTKQLLSSLGDDPTKFFILSPPPVYPQEGKFKDDAGWLSEMNMTARNEIFSNLYPEMASELNLPGQNYIDVFAILGGHNHNRLDLMADRAHPS